MSASIAAHFTERSRYYLGVEYPTKIGLAIGPLTTEQLWWRANASSNSIGNLMLHLAGNVRQWIVSGVGGAPDVRARDEEFAATSGLNGAQLLARLTETCNEAAAVIAALSEAELGQSRLIQGRDTSVFSAVYHVVEHFAGHTGQIILLAKQFAPGAVRFYDDAGGLARPLFLTKGESDIV